MRDIFYIPNPDEASPVGLLEVPIENEEYIHHDAAYADLIRQAIEVTGIQDPQALVMEAFYRGNGIPRELMGAVESTVRAVDVADDLRGRLYDLVDEDSAAAPFSVTKIQELVEVLDTEARERMFYLTPEGLVADVGDPQFKRPHLYDMFDPHIEFTEEEFSAVDVIGAVHYAYESELVWRKGESGSVQPRLLTGRQHLALGRLANDGTFEHIDTLLDPSHPARQ